MGRLVSPTARPQIVIPNDPYFTPRSEVGCVFWMRPDINAGLVDLSGLGNASRNLVVMGTPTYTLTDATFNNYPTYAFPTATAPALVSGPWSAALPQPATIYVVGQGGTAVTAFFVDGIDNANRIAVATVGSQLGCYAGAGFILANISFAYNAKHITCSVLDGASSSFYVDGFTTAAATGNPGAQGIAGVTIGNSFNLLTAAGGLKVAEVAIFSGAHTLPQRSRMMKYLGARYGVIVS